jgi:hypothetical protein
MYVDLHMRGTKCKRTNAKKRLKKAKGIPLIRSSIRKCTEK